MRKLFALLFVAGTLAFVSCGEKKTDEASTTEVVTDSSATVVDESPAMDSSATVTDSSASTTTTGTGTTGSGAEGSH